MQRSLAVIKNVPLILPVHICFQCHLLTLSLPLHSQCFRGNSLAIQTPLNVLQWPFVEILISRRIFMYKGWSKVMHSVSTLNFGSIVTECNVTRNILQWDLMHWYQQLEEVLREIFQNIFHWLLIVFNQTNLVDGYGKNKYYIIISQDLTRKEPVLNHSL